MKPLRLTLGLTLAMRALFLVRFGADPSWADAVYLAQAKSLALGPARIWGPPLPILLIFGGRAAGLSAVAALECIYLLAHLAFAAGVAGVAQWIWPSLPRMRGIALAVIVATLPMIAGDPGYGDIGAILGAGLLSATFALALAAASSPAPRPGLLAALAGCAVAAGLTRIEALAGMAGAAAVLALAGRRLGMARPRAIAALLAAAVAGALALTAALHRRFVGAAELTSPTYAFYTFYAGLPVFMCSGPCGDEYAWYRESMRLFGSFAEHHGSVAHALAAHPGRAVLRVAWKVVEWGRELAYPNGVGPHALAFALVGAAAAWRAPSTGARRGWVLVAYLFPFAVILAPPVVPMYLVVCLPPLLLAMARGAEAVAARLPSPARIALLAVALAGGIACATWFGHPHRYATPVAAPVAAYLEQRCRAGCLTNFAPQHVAAEAWVDLEAGAPLPRKNHTDEAFVLGRVPPDFAAGCDFRGRVARARAAGWRGPVLYLEFETRSAHAYSELGFDQEHDLEGPIDLRGAVLERSFVDGGDRAEVWRLPIDQ